VTKERLQSRLITYLELNGTRILILDECQKLLSSRNSEILDIFELFKDLSTKTNWSGTLRTQIILCGTKDGIPLLEAADWIQGRTRTIKLLEIDGRDFGVFLLKIFKYYTSIGISENWDLVTNISIDQKRNLNEEVALYLFGRTHGKVGLTADLIREAMLHALHEGRLYPDKQDFEAINLDEKTYIMADVPYQPESISDLRQIHLSLQDRCCKVGLCKRSTQPYEKFSSLLHHYKFKHPQVELVYGDKK
jgi:hypothetical protein